MAGFASVVVASDVAFVVVVVVDSDVVTVVVAGFASVVVATDVAFVGADDGVLL